MPEKGTLNTSVTLALGTGRLVKIDMQPCLEVGHGARHRKTKTEPRRSLDPGIRICRLVKLNMETCRMLVTEQKARCCLMNEWRERERVVTTYAETCLYLAQLLT